MNGINITIAIAVGLALLAFIGVARADRTDCTLLENIDTGEKYWDCGGEMVESHRDNRFVDDDGDHRQADRICSRARADRGRYGRADRAQIIISCAHLDELRKVNEKLDAWLERDKRRSRSGFHFELPLSSGGGLR